MAKILIAYHTRTQPTQHMAEIVAEGARAEPGVSLVDVKAVKSTSPRELLNYDAIVLGSPTYYGDMAAEVKKLLDDSVAIHGQLDGKVGGAFASSANIGGGNETTLTGILHALLIHGMVIHGSSSGDHYGPVAIGDVDNRSRDECRKLGKSVGALAVKLWG